MAITSAPVSADVRPQPYRTGDYAAGGFPKVLPPGEIGSTSAADLVALYTLNNQIRPVHSFDRHAMHGDLLYAAPRRAPADLGRFSQAVGLALVLVAHRRGAAAQLTARHPPSQ